MLECNKLSLGGLWEIRMLVLNTPWKRKKGKGGLHGEDDIWIMILIFKKVGV